MNTSDQAAYEELSIGTEKGLRAFLANANAQYQLGLKKEEAQNELGDYSYGTALHDAYARVRETTNNLLEKLSDGQPVSDDDAELLQLDYDRLVRVITTVASSTTVSNDQANKTNQNPGDTSMKVSRSEISGHKTDKEPEGKSVTVTEQNQADKDGSKKLAPAKAKKQPRLKQTTSHQAKPKTGALTVNSDDVTVDVKERVTVRSNGQSKKPTTKTRSAQKKQRSVATASVYFKKIRTLVADSTARYESHKRILIEPDAAEELLLAEVSESIEQLDILSKKTDITEKQFTTVSQLVSHISHALQALEEYRPVIKENMPPTKTVPVVTTESTPSGDTRPTATVSFVPTSVTKSRSTVVKQTIPRRLQTLPKPADVHQSESLTERYLTAPAEQQFITTHYSSTKAFEQILDATVTKIEAETIDSIEKWLGDLPASAFAFIKDMKVSELEAFADRPYEAVLEDLEQENIKYETFAEWRDLLPEMKAAATSVSHLEFGALYAKWMLSLAMSEE